MVYRGLDIGTAKPPPATRAAVPHHLIDILEPTESYSAGRFARDAARAIAEIRARGRLPLLVGGTLLYLRALRDGLVGAAARGPRRTRATSIAKRQSTAGRAARTLAPTGPGGRGADCAERPAAHPARARGARADRPADHGAAARGRRAHAAAVSRSRSCRKQGGLRGANRAALRCDGDARLRRGGRAVARARRSSPRHAVDARRRLSPALGAISDGDYGWDEARSKAIVATRQYAKRQLTWLRGDPRTAKCGRRSRRASSTAVVERLSKENLIAKNGRGLC